MNKTNYIVFGVLALALATFQSPKLAFADDIVLPTVETVSYDSNSVNLRGNLIDMGGATVVNVGFELGTTTSYGIIVNNSVPVMTTTGEWTDGPPVTCSTTYHFRAFASNEAGTAYGADMTFDTVVCPYAQTDVETSVTETGATLNGTLPGLGFVPPVGVYFEYSSDPSMSSPTITPTITLSTVGAFNQSITGLSCGTYYFRAVSTDGVNPFHTGVLRSFMTCPPVVTTSPAQYTSITSTRLTGSLQSVINNDYLVSPFFEYGTTIAYGTTVTADGVFTIAGGDMKADMYNLACGTEYHYRAGGTNIRGTGYGDDMTFTTLACDMAAGGIFIVTGASAITETSATLSGELVSLGSGGPATISFDYGTTSSYGTTVTLPGTNHVPHESYSTTLT
ncbi:MAG: hypothetical protein KAY23_05250, partial [Phocaeicola sp.]|nr:hypothetical protein [Phocaeicola sp.]